MKRYQNYRSAGRAALGALLAGALGMPLAGCGGGGSNGTQAALAPAASPAALSGTVQDASGGALARYQVVYDLNVVNDSKATLTATTDAQGHYALTVPARDITGADTLSFLDSHGSLAATQAVTLSAGGRPAPLTTTISLAPPPPAPLTVPK